MLAGCLKIQINFDTISLEIDSTDKELSPTRPYSPLQTPEASHHCFLLFWLAGYKLVIPTTPSNSGCQLQVQVVTCTSDQLAKNQRFPYPFIPRLNYTVFNDSQNSGKPVYSLNYQFIKRILNDTNKQMKRYTGQNHEQRIFCSHGTWSPVWWHMEAFWFPNMEVLQKRAKKSCH